jgi:hypothetical protein
LLANFKVDFGRRNFEREIGQRALELGKGRLVWEIEPAYWEILPTAYRSNPRYGRYAPKGVNDAPGRESASATLINECRGNVDRVIAD